MEYIAIRGFDDFVAAINSFANNLEALVLASTGGKAVSAKLVVPRYRSLTTNGGVHMPTNIIGDLATVVPIEFDNLSGAAVPAPTGGTSTVANDNPGAATAVVETESDGSLALVISPVQPAQVGAVCNLSISDTLADGTAITTPTVDFVITADTQAANAHLDTTHMTTRPLGP